MPNSICVIHDGALSGWSWSLGCLGRVRGVKTSGIVLIVCDPKTHRSQWKVNAGAEGPWLGLLKASVLWFFSVSPLVSSSVSSPELFSNEDN